MVGLQKIMNSEIKKFLSENKLNIQETKASIFVPFYVYRNFIKMSRIYPGGFTKIVCIHKNNYLWQYLSQNDLDQVMENLNDEYIRNNKKFLLRYDKWLNSKNHLINICKNINLNNLESESIEKVWSSYIKFSNSFSKFWEYASIGEEKGIYIENHIVPYFIDKWKTDTQTTKEIISILVNPDSISIFTQEKIDFLSICLSKQRDKGITDYLNKYYWKKTNFCEAQLYKIENLTKEIETELKKGVETIKAELSIIKEELRVIKKKKSDFYIKYITDDKDKKIIEYLRLMVRLGEERKEPMMMGFYFLFSYLKMIASKLDLKYEDMTYLCGDNELEQLMKGTKSIKIEISKRKKGILFVFDSSECEPTIKYKEDLGIIEKFLNKSEPIELRGNVASMGNLKYVEGIARIVINPEKDEFNEGEILVTSMTRIDYVPLMKKAKAIITNEGGLTCHAAIVSREFNVPCVIGTKRATTTLKNGDKILINLNNGLITIQ